MIDPELILSPHKITFGARKVGTKFFRVFSHKTFTLLNSAIKTLGKVVKYL